MSRNVADVSIVRDVQQASEFSNASRYCTGKASLSDRSARLPFLTAVGKFKEIPVASFHPSTAALAAFSTYTSSGTS